MNKSYDNSLKIALMMLFTMFAAVLATDPAVAAVNIGGLTTSATSMFKDINNLMVVIGTGIGVIGFVWACIEYFINKSPIIDCAKIAGVAVLVGGGVAIIGAAVDFGKTI